MNTKPTKRELTHDRIVEVAARAVRRGGYAGVGVADVMKEAGLTHGGFYAHFDSREAMLVEAVARAGRDSSEGFDAKVAERMARGDDALRAIVETYLSDAHLAGMELGCPIAALASEMPRQTPALLAVSAERVQGLIAKVQLALPQTDAKERASVIVATLVGALQLARVLGPNAQGRALLAATRRAVLEQHGAP